MTPRRFTCALLFLFACGADDGIDSGLPANTPGGELMPAEQRTLCEAAADYMASRVTDADWAGLQCTLDVFGEATMMADDTAGQIAACNTLRSQCIADSDEKLGAVCDESQGWASCGATVAEIETCLEDTIDVLAGFAKDFNCDALDPARAMALQEKYAGAATGQRPASCDVVTAKCPEVFGGEDDEIDEEFEGDES